MIRMAVAAVSAIMATTAYGKACPDSDLGHFILVQYQRDPSNTISKTYGITLQSCAALCVGNGNCLAMNYRRTGGECELKSSQSGTTSMNYEWYYYPRVALHCGSTLEPETASPSQTPPSQAPPSQAPPPPMIAQQPAVDDITEPQIAAQPQQTTTTTEAPDADEGSASVDGDRISDIDEQDCGNYGKKGKKGSKCKKGKGKKGKKLSSFSQRRQAEQLGVVSAVGAAVAGIAIVVVRRYRRSRAGYEVIEDGSMEEYALPM